MKHQRESSKSEREQVLADVADFLGVTPAEAMPQFVEVTREMDEHRLLSPDSAEAPKYWRNEVGGKLKPAVERYINRHLEAPGDIDLIRAYLVQWIDSPVWAAHEMETAIDLANLRADARKIQTRRDVDRWIHAALDLAIDPL